MSDPVRERSIGATLAGLFVYGAAMGWLEAVVVVYIRDVIGLAHGVPMPPPDEAMAALRSIPWLLSTEQGREAATIVMIAAVAWLAERRWAGRAGAFLIVFGVWDIVYYIGLYAHLGWPQSLASMDLLFLIPPSPLWHQPVWVPIAISFAMIAGGIALIRRARRAG